MNILHTECSLNWGGQEYRTLLECQWLNAHGHRAWIMCAPRSALYQRGQREGVPVLGVELNSAWRQDSAWRIWRHCRRHRVDLINSHGSHDSALALPARWLGVPLVRSRQITNPIRHPFSYRHSCDHIIAAARQIREDLLRLGVAADKVSVVGEGVDLEEFRPDLDSSALRAEFGLPPGAQVVVNIGMIRPDKGQAYYLEAARALLEERPDVYFFCVGEGTGGRELERELRDKIQAYGLRQRFLMPGYRDDIAQFIHLADLVVVASTGTEAQSRIVPQAFASRRAVVATAVGGLPELVHHRHTGVLVEPASAPDLAQAIAGLLDDAGLRQTLAANGYAYARQHLSFAQMMRQTLAVYQTLIR